MADPDPRTPRELVRGLRRGLEADMAAGLAWIPWDGPPPADRLQPPVVDASAPSAAPATTVAPHRRVSGKDLAMKDRQRNLAAIAREVAACTACRDRSA